MMVNSLGFLFCFIYPGMGVGEASNLEILTGTHKNKQANKQPPIHLTRGPRKGSLARLENFETISTLLQPNATVRTSPHPHPRQVRPKGEPGLPSSPGSNRGVSGETEVGNGNFSPPLGSDELPLHAPQRQGKPSGDPSPASWHSGTFLPTSILWCLWRPCGETGLSPLPGANGNKAILPTLLCCEHTS